MSPGHRIKERWKTHGDSQFSGNVGVKKRLQPYPKVVCLLSLCNYPLGNGSSISLNGKTENHRLKSAWVGDMYVPW